MIDSYNWSTDRRDFAMKNPIISRKNFFSPHSISGHNKSPSDQLLGHPGWYLCCPWTPAPIMAMKFQPISLNFYQYPLRSCNRKRIFKYFSCVFRMIWVGIRLLNCKNDYYTCLFHCINTCHVAQKMFEHSVLQTHIQTVLEVDWPIKAPSMHIQKPY